MQRYLISGLLGAAIAVVCLIPPILHFVTGPLGPLIGGVVGGMRMHPHAHRYSAWIIGATLGLSFALFLMALGGVVFSAGIASPGQLNSVLNPDSLHDMVLLLLGISIYGAGLGTLGVWLAGRMKQAD